MSQADVQGINFCGHFPNLEQPKTFFGIVNGLLSRYLSDPAKR